MSPPAAAAAAAAAFSAPRSRLVASVTDWLKSRRQVGSDRTGNKFFEQYVAADKPRKRVAEYRDPTNVASINVLWWQWLNYLRDAPPSERELARLEAQQTALQRKVSKLEAEDEKLRLRQYTAGELGDGGDGGGGGMSSAGSDRGGTPNAAQAAAADAMRSLTGSTGGGGTGGDTGDGSTGGGGGTGDAGSTPRQLRGGQEQETAKAQSWSGEGHDGGARRRRR